VKFYPEACLLAMLTLLSTMIGQISKLSGRNPQKKCAEGL